MNNTHSPKVLPMLPPPGSDRVRIEKTDSDAAVFLDDVLVFQISTVLQVPAIEIYRRYAEHYARYFLSGQAVPVKETRVLWYPTDQYVAMYGEEEPIVQVSATEKDGGQNVLLGFLRGGQWLLSIAGGTWVDAKSLGLRVDCWAARTAHPFQVDNLTGVRND